MSDERENFEFPWPMFKVVLEGTSFLDVPKLEVRSMEEATGFVQAYGFELSNPNDSELLWTFFEDAVAFIERVLVDPQKHPEIPEHLRTRRAVSDLRRLLLIASDSAAPDQVFACAILRLMHVLIHLAHDPRLKYFDEVQNQVLSRLDGFLFTDAQSGTTYLGGRGDGTGIKLLFLKKKDRKDRDREIIKLLHKNDSLVEEIYDRLGFRLVTETRYDAVRAVRLMLEKNIISVPNLRPGRSRNRLVDLKRLMFEIDRIAAHLKKSEEPAPYVEKLIRRLERRIGPTRLGRSLINPHSSEYFRAFQFTCRELVRVRNPAAHIYSQLKGPLEGLHGGQQVLDEVFPKVPPAYDYVFFPYEIQIMDVKAYADSVFGKSNHEEYRKKQLEAARVRVFGRR